MIHPCKRASAALESGRFKEARMIYEEASRMDPEDRLATLGRMRPEVVYRLRPT